LENVFEKDHIPGIFGQQIVRFHIIIY